MLWKYFVANREVINYQSLSKTLVSKVYIKALSSVLVVDSMSSAVINRNVSEKKEGMVWLWECVSVNMYRERCNKSQKKWEWILKLPLNIFLCVYTHHAAVVSCQFVSYLFQDLQIMTFSCWLLPEQVWRVAVIRIFRNLSGKKQEFTLKIKWNFSLD